MYESQSSKRTGLSNRFISLQIEFEMCRNFNTKLGGSNEGRWELTGGDVFVLAFCSELVSGPTLAAAPMNLNTIAFAAASLLSTLAGSKTDHSFQLAPRYWDSGLL